MRHFWTTIALLLGVGAGSWFGFFRAQCDHHAHAAARAGDTLEWLRCEFHLSEAQHAAILRLHEEQSIVCAEHCALVAEARERLAAARRSGDAAALAAATAQERDAEAVCRASTEAHVRRVAAVMAPAQGQRYLAMVLPRLAALDHRAPPNVTLDR
ncbi:MAG: hypothetical protein QM691_04240 [Opitutaceae bacterium]